MMRVRYQGSVKKKMPLNKYYKYTLSCLHIKKERNLLIHIEISLYFQCFGGNYLSEAAAASQTQTSAKTLVFWPMMHCSCSVSLLTDLIRQRLPLLVCVGDGCRSVWTHGGPSIASIWPGELLHVLAQVRDVAV